MNLYPYTILLSAAVLYLLGCAAVICLILIFISIIRHKHGSKLRNKMIGIAAFAFLGTFFFRFFAETLVAFGPTLGDAIYGNLLGLNGVSTVPEIIADSLIHAMQTFSMDEDYTAFLLVGKQLIAQILPGAFIVKFIYSANVCLLDVIAPVIGGAIIFDILCDLFPTVRYQLQTGSTKYIFSCLNEQSVTLAESVREKNGRCTIIFTDTYADTSSERVNELLLRAKKIRAFCFADDISIFEPTTWLDARLHFTHHTFYILINENRSINIESVEKLRESFKKGLFHTSNKNQNALLVLSDSDTDTSIIESCNNAGETKTKSDLSIPIAVLNDRRNTILRLLYDHPIFLPMRGCSKDSTSVMVIGSDPMAEELISQLFWCGQMLNPETNEHMQFTIYSISESQDAMNDLKTRLQHRMPEAFGDMPGFNRAENLFASIRFETIETCGSELKERIKALAPELSNIYITIRDDVVARNTVLAVQRTISSEICRNENSGQHVMIYCYLENEHISNLLEQCSADWEDLNNSPCHVETFGGLQNRFSYDNIFMSDLVLCSVFVNQEHSKGAYNPADFKALLTNNYNFNSSIALAVHSPYKFYSAGLLNETGKNPYYVLDINQLKEAAASFGNKSEKDLRSIFWLEHLRWCAYIWSIGYSLITPDEMKYYQKKMSPEKAKFEPSPRHFRLHNCLVPSGRTGGFFNRESILSPAEEWNMPEWVLPEPNPEWDALDRVSWATHQAALEYYRNDCEIDMSKEENLWYTDKDSGKRKLRRGLYQNYKSYDYTLLNALSGQYTEYLKYRNDGISWEKLLDMKEG